MKKILVSDFDGTFYPEDTAQISENMEAVKKFREAGNIFVINTGRSYRHFLKYKDRYDIRYDYIILDHGALILDGNDNLIMKFNIDRSVVDGLIADVNLESSVDFFATYGYEVGDKITAEGLTKINVEYSSREEAFRINDFINSKYGEFVHSFFVETNSIEVISRSTDKSVSVGVIAQMEIVDKSNVYTIGDGYSDIEMIRDFNGYAMKKSVDELKKYARGTFTSVKELIGFIMRGKV